LNKTYFFAKKYIYAIFYAYIHCFARQSEQQWLMYQLCYTGINNDDILNEVINYVDILFILLVAFLSHIFDDFYPLDDGKTTKACNN